MPRFPCSLFSLGLHFVQFVLLTRSFGSSSKVDLEEAARGSLAQIVMVQVLPVVFPSTRESPSLVKRTNDLPAGSSYVGVPLLGPSAQEQGPMEP